MSNLPQDKLEKEVKKILQKYSDENLEAHKHDDYAGANKTFNEATFSLLALLKEQEDTHYQPGDLSQVGEAVCMVDHHGQPCPGFSKPSPEAVKECQCIEFDKKKILVNYCPVHGKDCHHLFWRDENPEGCLNCGKTKRQLFEEKYELKSKSPAPKRIELPREITDFDIPFKDFSRGETNAVTDVIRELVEVVNRLNGGKE